VSDKCLASVGVQHMFNREESRERADRERPYLHDETTEQREEKGAEREDRERAYLHDETTTTPPRD